MSAYIEMLCPVHGDWYMDIDNPCECPQCPSDKERIAALEAELSASQATIAKKNEALDRLAKLGNGDRYGNSEGNRIAQEALALPSDRSALDAMLAEARKQGMLEAAGIGEETAAGRDAEAIADAIRQAAER